MLAGIVTIPIGCIAG
ncbi:hypothetical protein ACUOCP_29245, partial [Escherichia sp. R-CC3]